MEKRKFEENFGFHKLNGDGQHKAKSIALSFEILLESLEHMCTDPRAWAIVKTKCEEACFYAKKSMALDPVNQEANA